MDHLSRELRPPPAEAPARLPLSARRHAARLAAAKRIAARTTTPLLPDQRRRDPLVRDRRGSASRIIRGFKATAGSILVHAAIVGLGFLVGTETVKPEKIDQKMVIEVREPPPPPPLPPEPAQVEAEVPRPAPPVEKKAPPPKAPPPEPEPAEPPPKTPPPRVVGLSMESTTEGGSGPSFAVGNTRQGTTAERAVDPAAVPAVAPGEPAPGTNQTASRLPSAGVVYTKPVRKRVVKPVYPETLKAQGLEADVKISLSLDATGKVVAVKILTPSTYPEFNEAARVAALTEEFEPALRDGAAIPYSLPFTYRFRLEDE